MSSIKKNFLYNLLLSISSVVFPLITAPYISRVLEPDGVGLYNFANTYAAYFALVALLGIPIYGVRETAKVRDSKEEQIRLVSELMSIATITTVCVSLLYIVTIALVGQLNENHILFLVAGFVIYLAPIKVDWFYQGVEHFRYITIRSLIIRTLSVILLFVLVRDKDDLIIYVILSVFGGVLGDIWNFIRLRRIGIKPHITFTGLKKHIKPVLLLFTTTIAASIYTMLDTLMLGFVKDYNEVGYYTNAIHISRAIISAVTSLSIVVIPRVSYYMKMKDYSMINELVNKSVSFVSFLSFPMVAGLISLASPLVPLFLGPDFVGSIVPLMILSFLIVIVGLNNIMGLQALMGMGYDSYFLYAILTGTVTNFILNMVFIPLWGAIGASIASVVAESLVLAVAVFLISKRTPISVKWDSDWLKVMIGSILIVPMALIIKTQVPGWAGIGLAVITGAVLYIIAEILMKHRMVDLIITTIASRFMKNNSN